MRALLNATNDTALLIDAGGTVLALNETASRRLARLARNGDHSSDPDTYVGACVYELFPDGLADERRARNEEVMRTGRAARFEDHRDGRWMDNTIHPVVDENGTVTRLAIFSRDVTDHKLAEESLRTRAEQLERLNANLASTLEELARSQGEFRERSTLLGRALEDERERARRDALTGTLNHGAIIGVLRERLQESRRTGFAVAMVDVDDMKLINDTYGHRVGDTALTTVATALQHENAVVGRYGGDEFVVLLSDADANDASQYKHQVFERLALARVIDTESKAAVPVVVSMGFAICPDDAETVTELITRSDDEMYAAKRQRPIVRGDLESRRLAG